MLLDKDKICQDAIDTFGVDNQFDMVSEEFGELIQALNKIKRTFDVNKLSEIKDGKIKFNSVKESLIYCNMCSEIADAKVMIRQLEHIFSKEHIDISEERKLIRLEERISKYKQGNNNAKGS